MPKSALLCNASELTWCSMKLCPLTLMTANSRPPCSNGSPIANSLMFLWDDGSMGNLQDRGNSRSQIRGKHSTELTFHSWNCESSAPQRSSAASCSSFPSFPRPVGMTRWPRSRPGTLRMWASCRGRCGRHNCRRRDAIFIRRWNLNDKVKHWMQTLRTCSWSWNSWSRAWCPAPWCPPAGDCLSTPPFRVY